MDILCHYSADHTVCAKPTYENSQTALGLVTSRSGEKGWIGKGAMEPGDGGGSAVNWPVVTLLHGIALYLNLGFSYMSLYICKKPLR